MLQFHERFLAAMMPSNRHLLHIISIQGLSFKIFKEILLSLYLYPKVVPELRRLFIVRVLQLYTMEPNVKNIVYYSL